MDRNCKACSLFLGPDVKDLLVVHSILREIGAIVFPSSIIDVKLYSRF